MLSLQELAEGYLRCEGFDLIESREGYSAATRQVVGCQEDIYLCLLVPTALLGKKRRFRSPDVRYSRRIRECTVKVHEA